MKTIPYRYGTPEFESWIEGAKEKRLAEVKRKRLHIQENIARPSPQGYESLRCMAPPYAHQVVRRSFFLRFKRCQFCKGRLRIW